MPPEQMIAGDSPLWIDVTDRSASSEQQVHVGTYGVADATQDAFDVASSASLPADLGWHAPIEQPVVVTEIAPIAPVAVPAAGALPPFAFPTPDAIPAPSVADAHAAAAVPIKACELALPDAMGIELGAAPSVAPAAVAPAHGAKAILLPKLPTLPGCADEPAVPDLFGVPGMVCKDGKCEVPPPPCDPVPVCDPKPACGK